MAVAVCVRMSVGADVEEGNEVGDGDGVASCIPVAVCANAAASGVDASLKEVQPANKKAAARVMSKTADL